MPGSSLLLAGKLSGHSSLLPRAISPELDQSLLAPAMANKYTYDLFPGFIMFPTHSLFRLSAPPSLRLVTLGLGCLYWLLIVHIPWPNRGDYGMNLPMNLLSWSAICLQALIIWLLLKADKLRLTPTFLLLLAGAILFTLPLLWSPHAGLSIALPRIVGIWGGVLIYLALVQQPVREKDIVALFYLLASAAIIETAISLAGFYCPEILPFPLKDLAVNYKGYAPGIFQQLNVTASFLATGLLALLFLLADKRRTLLNPRTELVRLAVLSTSLLVISATLVLFHSRIGWLGGVCGMICASLLFGHHSFRDRTTLYRRFLIVILPIAGCIMGSQLLNQSISDSLIHESSTHQRYLTLEYTLRMILIHPWQGWGMGMFESTYQHFMATLPFANPNREMMQHPHNETLFIWWEGGAVALMGGLSVFMGWISLFRRRKNVWQWAALLTTLPILLHTQVEFPLYYSVAHFFAILLLMSAADGRHSRCQVPLRPLRPVLAALSVYGIVLSLQLFRTSITLGNFETGRLEAPDSIAQLDVPWLMQQRWQRALSQLHLLHYNQSGDLAELKRYVGENAQWITLHMEEDAYNDQIAILAFLRRDQEAQTLKEYAQRLMPWDKRFRS